MLSVKKAWHRFDRWMSQYDDALARSATDARIWEPWLKRREDRKRAKTGEDRPGRAG
jgi:hypothetical protein